MDNEIRPSLAVILLDTRYVVVGRIKGLLLTSTSIMSTHSPSSPKDPALVLAPDLPLFLQPNLDPRTSTSSPTDMHSDSKYNHQNISRESSENAASSSPEVRNTHAPSTDASKYIGTLGRPVEQSTRLGQIIVRALILSRCYSSNCSPRTLF